MTKFNFTADELNEIIGWNNGKMKHSTRWNRLRKKFADIDEDQFNRIYAAFYDLLNTIRTTSDLGTLQKAVGNFATLPIKTFTSADNGVYTIKNVALNKYLYITDTDNAKHATLLNDETETKQKHYFYVKFNDNGISMRDAVK